MTSYYAKMRIEIIGTCEGKEKPIEDHWKTGKYRASDITGQLNKDLMKYISTKELFRQWYKVADKWKSYYRCNCLAIGTK